MTSAMALGLRNFAESNTAELMPLRIPTVPLRMVPPWVLQNPQYFHAAIAAQAPCTTLMYASIVTKEQKKMKLFPAKDANSEEKSQSLSSAMLVNLILLMLPQNLIQVFITLKFSTLIL